MTERDKFERLAASRSFPLARKADKPDVYESLFTQTCWIAWRAAKSIRPLARVREAYENWQRGQGYSDKPFQRRVGHPDSYENKYLNMGWQMWQEAILDLNR